VWARRRLNQEGFESLLLRHRQGFQQFRRILRGSDVVPIEIAHGLHRAAPTPTA
jgi:hypothetical protein